MSALINDKTRILGSFAAQDLTPKSSESAVIKALRET